MMPSLEILLSELHSTTTLESLDSRYQNYLGKKGSLSLAMKNLGNLDPEERKKEGGKLTERKKQLLAAYEEKADFFARENINQQLKSEIIDRSLPGIQPEQGHYSLLAQVRRELEDIAHSMGFIVDYGTEVVSKFENFEAVNIPVSHPATEMHDTIYVDKVDERGENYVLKTHTSSAQNYVIKKYGVPLKAVLPGKCYRFDAMDATHDTMFYQFEGMVIDKNITIGNFKDVITRFLSAALKKEVEVRMRPGFFPFVEPGFEIDTRYEYTDPKTGKKEMSDRMEIL